VLWRLYCRLVRAVGLLKLFGSACRSEPVEILGKFNRFARYLFSALDSSIESNVIGVAVETVGFVGSTARGKCALQQQGFTFLGCIAVCSILHTYSVVCLSLSVAVCWSQE